MTFDVTNSLDYLAKFSGIILFFLVVLVLVSLVVWIFSSIGIMSLAKHNNIPNPWLAFIPGGYSYIIGKLGYEVYADEKNTTMTWVTLGLAIASIVLAKTDVAGLISLALLVLHSIAFYNIFRKINPQNYVVFTIFTVLTNNNLGGIFLYALRDKFGESVNNKVKENVTNLKEENKESQEEEKEGTKEKDKKETSKPKEEKFTPLYCVSCGAKLNKDAKFCVNCGRQIK